ncbi:MFS transporter [Catenulispora sp. NF23]|uniref:MFS transporter n=1 Tax=Catenulispora pinistramenti TaxID=2705254 RepID=UPI001BA80F3C|nr:MFS transporter [Catenulispora pinistramenti]MBS2535428.1 MFS transporter [Catenulispora pinistramenti]
MTTTAIRPATPASTAPQAPASASGTSRETARAQNLTLLVLLAGIFMTTLDIFIVNVAIPATQRDLHASPAAIQWIVAGYGLTVAAGVITAGRLGDMFGRRRMYALGMALFTAASAACGMAPTADLLIASRIVQGVGAALLSPQTLAIIGTAFEGAKRVRAFTAYALAMGLAAVFGQLIGGVLIDMDFAGLGWRSCFLINVPVGALALTLVPRAVPESKAEARTRLDLPGVALVSAALVATVLPLIQGQSQGWPLWTWLSFGAALVLFGVFGWHQGRLAAAQKSPLVDPALFRTKGFTRGIIAQIVFWMGQGSFFLVFALYLQLGRGLDALHAGLVFTAIGLGYLLTSMVAQKLAVRLGRQTAAVGTALMAVSLLDLIVTIHLTGTHGSLLWMLPALAADGAGMGLAIGPLAAGAMGRVAPHHTGAASGVVSTVMQVGGAVGVAVIGIVFYSALGSSTTPAAYTHAFTAGLELLVGVAVAVTVLLQFDKD